MSETDKPKYVGYGYHGGGRPKTANPKVFVNTTISGSPEEIAILKEQAKNAGKTVSRYVLDWVLSKEKKAKKVNTILHVTAVEPKENYTLLVTFDTGEKKLFDFTHLLDRPMYKPLKNKSFFDTVKIENGVTVWNDKIDIAPEYLYENGITVQ